MNPNQGNKPKGALKELWVGIGITVGIYLLGLLILLVFSGLFFPYLLLAAIALIVIPIVCFAKGKTRMGQGALIGLALNILLFSACFGIMITNLGG
ncbi:hypothetical protein COJ85_09150 [Bacillus sp. AFS076308]|uniref:hypothetical protein n=1 Tax=Bacillus sp. AFS076308 TaxID=2033512 RepID=UPI000BF89AC6|nr:hypothetical protein [Bacillus sp. AFS076308]PFO05835.1 hypothetical protein COJ85_09150 [Bacillus sp. AFS076308]